MLPQYEDGVASLVATLRESLGARLVSVVVFGSVAKGRARPDSDVDVLAVVHDLPAGQYARRRVVARAEEAASTVLQRRVPQAYFSLVLKTPDEVEHGGPLFYDMTVPGEADVLFDPEGFLAGFLARLRSRMAELGSVRKFLHGHPYWDLKPTWKPGDVIDL